jgi:hypothetical protein
LPIFGHSFIFAVIYHADNLDALATPDFEMTADGFANRPEDPAREL